MSDSPNPFQTSPNSSRPSTPAKGNDRITSLNAAEGSRASSPTPSSVPRGPGSSISAASGSPPPTHRASFPDPSKEPRKGSSRLSGPLPKQGFCCDRDRDIHKGEEISIVDAFKTTEGGKAAYITYVIRLGTHETRRRYSSFLSLHQALTGLYPVLIIPPIPSKQSLAEYAVKGQSKAKEDATTIARRKRLLEDFLRRLVRHPILGGDHVLHRFLEDGVSWNEVLHSPPISLLPKNPLHAPSHNPTFQPASPSSPSSPGSPPGTAETPTTPYIAHHLLPSPSASHPLRKPDQRFHDSEIFTEKFQSHFTSMEKVNRRVTKRWGERAQDMSELGAVWNGYSLLEKGKLGEAVEKVGQAVDGEYLATAALLQAWERSTTEPLHIYSQFAALIRQRLSFRHQKHVQFELVQDALDAQRDKLELLETAERESRRLDEALERGGSFMPGTSAQEGAGSGEDEVEARERARQRAREERDRAERTVSRARGSGFGLISAVKHSLSGMMDVDPEATRRANIGKTRDNISQLEDSLQASAQDLKYASTTLQADLDRFQRQKVADLRLSSMQLAMAHREWCQQNLEAWQAAAAAIREIESHPNQAPAEEAPTVPIKPDLQTRATSFGTQQHHGQSQSSFNNSIGGSSSRAHDDGPFPSSSSGQTVYPRMSETDAYPSMGIGMGSDNPLASGPTLGVFNRSMHMGGLREELERVEAANKPLPLPVNERELDMDDEPLMSQSRMMTNRKQQGQAEAGKKDEGEGGGEGSRVIDNPLGPL